MKEVITKIINHNLNLFKENSIVKKINVGFTNTVYEVNDKYIVKICTNEDNEKNFENEITFYKENESNKNIPKLYKSDTSKEIIPFYYEILEKISGVSLYNIWHKLTEKDKEDTIKQLCSLLKEIHKNKQKSYDWEEYLKDKFLNTYQEADNIFTEEEQNLLTKAYNKFSKYLKSTDFVLVHNDLHFDNIFYDNGVIKLIDFERAMIAPRDFELDILYRMVRFPWKFASEEEEEYIEFSDYTNIKSYVEKYYNELVNIPYLEERLAIYDLIYFLKHLVESKDEEELKKNVLSASKIVALKDELDFYNLKTPEELMDFMDINIEYGWLDKNKNKHINNLKGFRENYLISTIDEMLTTKVGTCIGQAKLIKAFFDRVGIENKLYCYRRYEKEDNFDKEVRMHCFVIYHKGNNWYHFEHSNSNKKGIHKYNSVEEILAAEVDRHDENDIRELVEIPSIPDSLTFKEFNEYLNNFDEVM